VTFDPEDLLHITLERALKITNADIGSVLILEQPQKDLFAVHAAIGLDDILRKGDHIDFSSSIAKYAVINKSPLIINDIENDARFGRENRPRYGTKSFMCMPLKGAKDVFGVLTLSRKTLDIPFTTADAEILAPLLSNAIFTYDNLRLINESEKSAQYIKMIDGLAKTMNSSLRGSELLHTFFNQVRTIMPFDFAAILIKDEEAPDCLSILDVISNIPTNISKNISHPYEGSAFDKAIRQGISLSVDITDQVRHPLEKELFLKHDLGVVILTPIWISGRIYGVLSVGCLRGKTLVYAKDQIETIASLISIAVERNKLTGYLMKRDREMEAIKQIGSALASSTFEMEEVLRRTMEMIQAVMDAEAGSLLILENDELHFKVAFNDKVDCDVLRTRHMKLGKGISGYSAARGESVIVRNVRESPQYDPEIDRLTGYTTRSVLCVPIISQGKVLGVIEVLNRRTGDFDENDIHLLQSIATSLSIALENARLYKEMLTMAEHERGIRNMFQKFVPKEIVDRIVHDTTSHKTPIEEQKSLTLLNIDLRNFSAISRRVNPRKTLSVLNYFFTMMGEIVFKHNGIVDKYLGDGFLAIFGAPVSSAYDADNAIAAAQEMKNKLQEINEHVVQEINNELVIGISIHTGEVLVGNIGFDKKMDYTVIGDAVNIVFRLQDLTKSLPNGILISETACRAAMNVPTSLREFGIYDAGQPLGNLQIYELTDS
jgi:adenylate cyclase